MDPLSYLKVKRIKSKVEIPNETIPVIVSFSRRDAQVQERFKITYLNPP